MKNFYAALLCMLFAVNAFAIDPATLYTINGINYALDGNKAIVYPLSYDFSEEYTGDIVIPSSVTINGEEHAVVGIDHRAFADQSELTSVTLPTSIEWLQEGCFSNSPMLRSIRFSGENEDTDNGLYRISSNVIYTVPQTSDYTLDFTNRDGIYTYDSNSSNLHYPQYNGLVSLDADYTEGNAATYFAWTDGEGVDHKVLRIFRGYSFTVSSQAGPIKQIKFFFDGRHNITVDSVSTGSLNEDGDTWNGREFSVTFDSHRRNNIDSIQVTLWSDSAQAFAAPRAAEVATIDSVCAIADLAFTNNASTTFTIPATVEYIGKNAISNLYLKEIHAQGAVPSYHENPFVSTDKTSCKLYVREQYADAYRTDSLWGRFRNIIVEEDTPSGISSLVIDKSKDHKQTYNLLGMPVSEDFKGIVIRNGKKYIAK